MAIKKAIVERDDEPQYHALRGRIELAADSKSAAFDAYRMAMSLDPTNMEALHAVSQLGLQLGRLRDSLEATEAILALTPGDPNALLVRGLHALVRSRFSEARDYAERILAQDPAHEGGAILLARVAAREGKTREAFEAIADFGRERPVTLGVAMTRLELYRLLRDAEGMRRTFAALRTLAPDRHELRIDEIDFAFKDDRPREALALLTALLADPDLAAESVPVLVGLWREYGAAELTPAALGAIARSGSVPARTSLAAAFATSAYHDAAAHLVEGLARDERAPVEALIAAQRGQLPRARVLAEDILARDASNCVALVARAQADLSQQRVRRSLRGAQLAASQCPGLRSAWVLAARSYAGRGDMDNARRVWRQGIRANPQDTLLARSYVHWLLDAGDPSEAVAVARGLTRDAPALLSGWRLYLETCRRAGRSCEAAAAAGIANAATRYGIDPPPGERPPNGLFGRIVSR